MTKRTCAKANVGIEAGQDEPEDDEDDSEEDHGEPF